MSKVQRQKTKSESLLLEQQFQTFNGYSAMAVRHSASHVEEPMPFACMSRLFVLVIPGASCCK
jgi:hypothetical protein